jgi:hypothetical protein
MSNKETVQKGLDARKDVHAAKEETEQIRKELEEAGHELVRQRLSHENDKNYWNREKSELIELLIRECNENRTLAKIIEHKNKQEKEAEQRGLLANVLKTVVALILIVAFRDLNLVNTWLAAALAGVSTGYLAVAVVRLARGLRK